VIGIGQVEVDHHPQERVRHLQQHARAVTGGRVGAGGTTMVEVLQRRQALGDDVVAGLAAELGHERDPAGVMFVVRVVEALGCSAGHGQQSHLMISHLRANGAHWRGRRPKSARSPTLHARAAYPTLPDPGSCSVCMLDAAGRVSTDSSRPGRYLASQAKRTTPKRKISAAIAWLNRIGPNVSYE